MNLRVKDIADLLNISQKTIYRMIRNETIPCFRVGGQWRFDRGEISSWIEDTRDIQYYASTIKSSFVDEESISVTEFLKRGGIYYNVTGNTKEEAVLSCLTLIIKSGIPRMDTGRLFDAIMEREKLCPTAVGHGIAFPHPKPFTEFASKLSSIALCRLDRPIPFDALDNEKVDTLFFIFPRNERRYLRIQAKLSRLLKDDEIISAVKNISLKDELYEVFSRREADIFGVKGK